MKRLFPLLAVALSTSAHAQSTTRPSIVLTLTQRSIPVRQPAQLTLEVYNSGNTPATIGRIRRDSVACPPFKLFGKAGGAPRIERYLAADCDVGETVTVPAGQRRRYRVTLPWSDLRPGAYTAFLELPVNGATRAVRADLSVGPGPFVTELVLPGGARAGRALDLRVAYRNVWRTPVGRGFSLCDSGLLIRDGRGRIVYDNRPEETACTTQPVPIVTVAPGGTHLQPWGGLPRLRPGRYTALAWGGDLSAFRSFTVGP